jgi:excisionase family DNA binding protein
MDDVAHTLPRFAFSPVEAAVAAAVTRSRIFSAIRDNELVARKAGKRTLIEASELQRWLRSLPTRGRAPDTAT